MAEKKREQKQHEKTTTVRLSKAMNKKLSAILKVRGILDHRDYTKRELIDKIIQQEYDKIYED